MGGSDRGGRLDICELFCHYNALYFHDTCAVSWVTEEEPLPHQHAIYNYVQCLIMNCLSCQVFTFGSVPLKTYLPDGDIDVTAFSDSEELKNTWANLVRDALEHEEKSENAEFHVKEVQYIHAEVESFL
ncbi:hypothetical protein ABZP36_026501 [Zizania latifolia]